MSDELTVTILGTGTPSPLIDRMGGSVLVEGGGDKFLIDCGRGAAQRVVQTDTPLREIETVFFTHLHYDHNVGLPDLWLSGWVFGRKKPVTVYGPPGTEAMMEHLKKAFEVDVHIRRDLDEKFEPEGIVLQGIDIGPGFVYEQGGLRVESFEVDHHPVPDAMGYIVDYENRRAVFSGDTRYMPSLGSIAKGADLLVHEVAAPDSIWKRSKAIRREPSQTAAIIDHHTTAEQAAKIFDEARPRLAVFYHLVGGPGAEEEVITSTKSIYDGDCILADDLTKIVIGDQIDVGVIRQDGPLDLSKF